MPLRYQTKQSEESDYLQGKDKDEVYYTAKPWNSPRRPVTCLQPWTTREPRHQEQVEHETNFLAYSMPKRYRPLQYKYGGSLPLVAGDNLTFWHFTFRNDPW